MGTTTSYRNSQNCRFDLKSPPGSRRRVTYIGPPPPYLLLRPILIVRPFSESPIRPFQSLSFESCSGVIPSRRSSDFTRIPRNQVHLCILLSFVRRVKTHPVDGSSGVLIEEKRMY